MNHQKNNDIAFLIVWPKPQNEADYFEHQYGLKFCKKYLQDSLQQHHIQFNWVDANPRKTESISHQFTKYVLVINDPLLIISGTIIKAMMEVIDMGYTACGPLLNISSNKMQLASTLFPVINSTTYEELNKLYQKKGESNIDASEILDPACVIYDAKYFNRHKENLVSNEKKAIGALKNKNHFAVLKNALVITFKSAYSNERNDLAGLIPAGVNSVLDVGCFYGGLGKILKHLRPETETDGIELSEFYATKASPFYRKIYNCTLEEFQNEKQYNAVVCGDILEHLFDPWKQLHRINTFLKTGGSLIVSLPNAGHWSLIYDQLNGKFEYLPWGITCITHIRWFTESSIRKALMDAGFQIVLFERQQIEPTPKGKDFINKMVEFGFGDERSLLTNEFIIRAVKK